MSSQSAALFACSRCKSRHPFEELSQGQQLCKACRASLITVKCTYCRSEFHPEGNKTDFCRKCDHNLKQHGKPRACDYCNLIAAFIGTKCQRCTNSEKKYGPPIICEQCKQKCAFDRKDSETQKKEGKHLCWLCTISYKRTLAKARISDPSRLRASSSRTSPTAPPTANLLPENGLKKKDKKMDFTRDHRKMRPDVTKVPPADEDKKDLKDLKPKGLVFPDPSSSDHVVALTKLNEQVMSLNKQLAEKEKMMLAKDKQIFELKADLSKQDREARQKLADLSKKHQQTLAELTDKLKTLQKQIVNQSKEAKESKAKKIKLDIGVEQILMNSTM